MGKKDQDPDYDVKQEPRKVHHLITPKQKKRLIELVEQDKLTIYKAAKRLKLCQPTAKFIMKKHRKSKHIKKEEEQPPYKVFNPPQEDSNARKRRSEAPLKELKTEYIPPALPNHCNMANYCPFVAYPPSWYYPQIGTLKPGFHFHP